MKCMLPFTKILRKAFVKNVLDHFANALKKGTFAYPAEKSDNIVSAGIINGVNRSFVSGREGARVDFVDWGGHGIAMGKI